MMKSLFRRNLATVLILTIAIFTSARTYAVEGEAVLLGQAIEEEVNRIADQLANALHTQDSLFAGRNPNVLIDQFVAQELAKQVEFTNTILANLPDNQGQIKKLNLEGTMSDSHGLNWHFFPHKERRRIDKLQMNMFGAGALSAIVMAFGFTFTGGQMENFLSYPGAVFATGALGFMTSGIFFKYYESIKFDEEKIKARFKKALATEVRKAFFQRLIENGIDVPDTHREEWLLSRIDGGGIVSPWEKLDKNEKLRLARECASFLEELSKVVSGSNPEASEKLLAESRQLAKAVDGARWYRFRSFRAVQAGLVKAIQGLSAIDKQYQVLARSELEVLNSKNRLVYDHPEIFTPEAQEFLRLSRSELPDVVRAFAPRLAEIGGKIDLQIHAQPDASQGVTRVKYEFTVEIPHEAPIVFSATLVDNKSIRASHGRNLILPNSENFEYRRSLNESLIESGFAEEIGRIHEAKFPTQACSHALSTAGPELRQSIENVTAEISAI